MPSTDAPIRGKIASLPSKLSNAAGVDEICVDSDVSRSFQAEIDAALLLLQDYNRRLDMEMEDRKRASMKLQDFLHAQKDLLTQAEQRLEVLKEFNLILLW